MNALLSIKPEFVNEIRSGNKKFEFRKKIFKNENVQKVIVYETSPISMVVGEFTITNILEEEPSKIWHLTHNFSGISKEFFDQYFKDSESAFAIEFDEFNEYEQPRQLSEFGVKAAPQSFVYVN